jgi:hypothetical protein
MSDLRDLATLCNEIDYLTKQVDTLRKERDEARRDVCYMKCQIKELEDAAPVGTVIQLKPNEHFVVADKEGWDCFKGLIR